MTGEQLRAWREQARLTQQQLATMLGISVATVCRWERRRLKNPEAPLPLWLGLAIRGTSGLPNDSTN